MIERILAARGVIDAAEVSLFCEPRLTHLHEPSALPDLDRAAERLLGSLRRREAVVIYGDYDVDGVAGAVILLRVCRAIAPEAPVSVYIPHRIDEGYGLNAEAMQRLATDGARLVVTVDCGVTAVGPAAAAAEAGLDLIITDHHAPPKRVEDLPRAFAVVHPGRPLEEGAAPYPFPDLCGAGVAFKVAWRLATMDANSERVSPAMRETLLDMMALAAMATIADIVPLRGENRPLARFGLARMKSTSIVGLNALIDAAGLAGEQIGAEQVGFVLGPRLNACGRMGHAREAVELLSTESVGRARELAGLLTAQNDRRRAVERAIFEQACAMAEAAGMTGEDRRAIVLASPDWHAGVVGIVCSRLVERFGRPAILMRAHEGECHGSCRSVDGFNIVEALAACGEHLDSFGGHDMAAGLRLREERLGAFTEAFVSQATGAIAAEDLVPSLTIDCEANFADLSPAAVERLERLAPFGRGNPHPCVLVRGARVIQAAEAMGAHGQHLRLTVREGGRSMRLVGWGWGERREALQAGEDIDVALRPRINRWNGATAVEGEIQDVRITSGAGAAAAATVISPSFVRA